MDKKIQLRLSLMTNDSVDVKIDDKFLIDDKVEAVVKDIHKAGLGFGSNQAVIEYLFNIFFVGVPSSLIAALIYDKFLKGKNKFIDETRNISIITKDELEKYINMVIEKSKE